MPKKIVLIVGASGVGKDTLLRSAKKLLKDDDSINFVNRYITRSPDSNEENFYVQKSAFEILDSEGFFISSWEAYNNYYGIAKESIKEGLNVISVSRSYIKDFELNFDELTTIEVTISTELLVKRLKLRSRENDYEIAQRIQRINQPINAKNLIVFDNTEEISLSSKHFTELLQKIAKCS